MAKREKSHIYQPGGGHSVNYERTDPNYVDKRRAGILKDYQSIEERRWKLEFLKGLDKKDHDNLIEDLKANLPEK